MQGYILNITPVRDEDLIVNILTPTNLYTLYRFYGARHSQINLGYKIDFEIEYQLQYLPKLRNIIHLNSSWLKNIHKALIWQNFIKLLYKHLQGVEAIDEFYYLLLEDLNRRLNRQDAKRAVVESYVKLLEFEGRLHKEFYCFICENKIDENPILTRAYLPACQRCIPKKAIRKEPLKNLYDFKDSQFLYDMEIERLYLNICEGL